MAATDEGDRDLKTENKKELGEYGNFRSRNVGRELKFSKWKGDSSIYESFGWWGFCNCQFVSSRSPKSEDGGKIAFQSPTN